MSCFPISFAGFWLCLAIACATYATGCIFQRHSQRHWIEAEYFKKRGLDLSNMTFEDAWEIQKWLAEQEFPKTLSTAVFFALFKTYSIPSISKLLVSTGHMTTSLMSLSRRSADTGLLLNNLIIAPPTSKRSIDAIVRTAWMHRSFRQSGKISNDDMLYTLSLFALEGVRWVQRYEWRCLTNLEICAIGVFWKKIGDDMDISYAVLGDQTLSNGLEWHRALEIWSRSYEIVHMARHPSNHALATSTMNLLTAGLPVITRRFAAAIFCHLIGPELRNAMTLPDPPPLLASIVTGFIELRRFILCYLTLPRSDRARKLYLSPFPSQLDSERYHSLKYRGYPWYIAPTTSHKVRAWLKGHPVPGPSFHEEGYRIVDLGPEELRGKGTMEMSEMYQAIRISRGSE